MSSRRSSRTATAASRADRASSRSSIDLHERFGAEFHTVAFGSLDLATADGRRMALFLAGEATAEGERVKRAKDEAATTGKYRRGLRPFGYRKEGVHVNDKEAALPVGDPDN